MQKNLQSDKLYILDHFENANYEDRDANLTDGTTVINIPASNQLTISSPNIGTWDGSNYVFGYTDETGGVEHVCF